MLNMIKKSIAMLNSNLKEIILFSILINVASFASTSFIPLCGIVVATMISFYMIQIFIDYAKTGKFSINDLEQPNISGMLKTYGFSMIINIPIVIVIFLGVFATFGAILKISILGLFIDAENTLLTMVGLIFASIAILGLLIILSILICPFYAYVFLDEDFKNNGFFKNIKLSFKLAKGYRFKIFLALLFNYALVFLSIFTLGLGLIYTQPLYVLLMCNLYNESKNKKLLLDNYDDIDTFNNVENFDDIDKLEYNY